MAKESQITRGKKWAKIRILNEANDLLKENEWMDSQPTIVADEQAYADSLNPSKETKSKKGN